MRGRLGPIFQFVSRIRNKGRSQICMKAESGRTEAREGDGAYIEKRHLEPLAAFCVASVPHCHVLENNFEVMITVVRNRNRPRPRKDGELRLGRRGVAAANDLRRRKGDSIVEDREVGGRGLS
jgi:hypothetical protein